MDVVLVNFGSAADTIAAVERLGQWTCGTVWVVDNSAHLGVWQEQTAALVTFCASKPWVRMLDSGGNIGFGRACNLAFNQSTAPLLLLLNPDARIAPQDVQAMAAHMQRDARLGALSPAVYWNEPHSFVLPLPSAQTPAALWGAALRTHLPGLSRFLARRSVRGTQTQMAQTALLPAAFLAGAVMLLRRSAVLQAGGLFDPEYFMFFEDADLSLRLRRQGYRLAVAPQIRAVHEYRHKAFKAEWMAQSHAHYFSRNFPLLGRQGKALERVRRWHKPMDRSRWFDVLQGPCNSAAEFAARTGHNGVLAWSPSLLMEPALCRPTTQKVVTFDEAEWALLEPGTYVALLADQAAQLAPRWLLFEKA